MSRKSKIVHEMINAVNARHRFGEDKHELKKEARKLSRETAKRIRARVFSRTEKIPQMKHTKSKLEHSSTGYSKNIRMSGV